jgi:hypothetical protein
LKVRLTKRSDKLWQEAVQAIMNRAVRDYAHGLKSSKAASKPGLMWKYLQVEDEADEEN